MAQSWFVKDFNSRVMKPFFKMFPDVVDGFSFFVVPDGFKTTVSKRIMDYGGSLVLTPSGNVDKAKNFFSRKKPVPDFELGAVLGYPVDAHPTAFKDGQMIQIMFNDTIPFRRNPLVSVCCVTALEYRAHPQHAEAVGKNYYIWHKQFAEKLNVVLALDLEKVEGWSDKEVACVCFHAYNGNYTAFRKACSEDTLFQWNWLVQRHVAIAREFVVMSKSDPRKMAGKLISASNKTQEPKKINQETAASLNTELKCCATCKKTENLKKCTRCKAAWYCSVDCQRKDFPKHKLGCKK
jgi:hypothetical protein